MAYSILKLKFGEVKFFGGVSVDVYSAYFDGLVFTHTPPQNNIAPLGKQKFRTILYYICKIVYPNACIPVSTTRRAALKSSDV